MKLENAKKKKKNIKVLFDTYTYAYNKNNDSNEIYS